MSKGPIYKIHNEKDKKYVPLVQKLFNEAFNEFEPIFSYTNKIKTSRYGILFSPEKYEKISQFILNKEELKEYEDNFLKVQQKSSSPLQRHYERIRSERQPDVQNEGQRIRWKRN